MHFLKAIILYFTERPDLQQSSVVRFGREYSTDTIILLYFIILDFNTTTH